MEEDFLNWVIAKLKVNQLKIRRKGRKQSWS